jgi:protein-S-isoprenylcysteine O-methyltransferase Ste14
MLLVMMLFAVAVGVNAGSVALQQRTQLFTRRFGARAWHVHLGLVTAAWAAFVLTLIDHGVHVRWTLPHALHPAGVAVLAVSAALWLWAFAHLGPQRLANGYFFGRGPSAAVRSGPFRWLRNPMYDSYALAFVGVGLVTNNAAFFVLAAESYLLLNIIEARVENGPFPAKEA